MKKFLLTLLSVVLITTIISCNDEDNKESSNDEVVVNKNDESTPVQAVNQNNSEAFGQLPLPIAERFIYMDAIGYAPGTTISKAEWDGQTIYLFNNPLMSSAGEVYNQHGNRLYGQKYYDAEWDSVFSTQITDDWEQLYPGGYQIFKQVLRFKTSIGSEGNVWRENIKLNELPDRISATARGWKANGSVYNFMLLKGNWKDKTYYYFIDEPSQSPFGPICDEDGYVLMWTDNASIVDFVTNSKDWQLLYVMWRSENIGCDGENEHQSGARLIEPVDANAQLGEFFKTELCGFFDQTEWDEEKLLVINSDSELQSAYTGDKPLPDIDFSRYTLILGKDWAANGSYQLNEIRLWDNGDDYTLDIDILQYVWVTCVAAVQELYYWKLYSKLDNKPITLNRTFTFNYDK